MIKEEDEPLTVWEMRELDKKGKEQKVNITVLVGEHNFFGWVYNIKLSKSVGFLKVLIAENRECENIPIERQKLIFNGVILENHFKLNNYPKLGEGSEINLYDNANLVT